MQRRTRRLIDDKRRNRRLKALTVLTLLLTALGAGWLNNERWRLQGRGVLSSLQEKISWLFEYTDISRDVSTMQSQMGVISGILEKRDVVTLADIDFTLGTRKHECRTEATEVAQNCKDALVKLSGVRQQLSALTKNGSNIVSRLHKTTSSGLFADISKIRTEAERTSLDFKRLCDNLVVLPWKYQAGVDECRRIVRLVTDNQSDNGDWVDLVKQHNEYVSWENLATNLIERNGRLVNCLNDDYRKLRAFPFDRENTHGVTLKTIKEELDCIEPLIKCGKDLCDTSFNRLDEVLSRYKSAVQRDLGMLSKLRDLHGDYVDGACVTSAQNALEQLTDLSSIKRNDIEELCSSINNSISKVQQAQGNASEALAELEAMGNNTSDEFIVKKCEENVRRINELQSSRINLESNIASLTNYISQVHSAIEQTANGVATSLKVVQLSLPDWATESRQISDELTSIKRKLDKVKGDFEQVQKTFVRYRDADAPGEMLELRERLERIRNVLSGVDTACDVKIVCSNGKELTNLTKRRDAAKKGIDGLVEKIQELSRDLNSALAAGKLREKRYVPLSNLNLVSSQLQSQAGVGHFNLALDIPTAGHHKVEIRFNKGRRSLYKLSPHMQHKVVARCVVSGVIDKEAELSWDDSTIGWQGSVILEGEFCSGINDLNLDLTFQAEGYRGETLRAGVWQFQHDGNDNFRIEFLVDGAVKNVLAEASAT